MRAGVVEFAAGYVDKLCDAYRGDARYLAAVRILFAVYVIVFPVDYTWPADVPAVLFHPTALPFSLLSSPPPAAALETLEMIRLALAVILLVGYRTVTTSIALTAVLILGSGIVHSYGKVDHFILFEILPIAMAAAGWGAAWSLDARSRVGQTRGLPILLWAMTVAFALFTAAAPKAVSGWLDPSRLATRGFVARDVADPTKLGPLTYDIFDIHAPWFWKMIDVATVFAEGWLVIALFFPILFRIGIAVLLCFHLGVYLTLGIEFDSYIFVYLPFFAPRAASLSQAAPPPVRAHPSPALHKDSRGGVG